jgi:alkanesulfonate monooxygenase SsuD/methylene tetrahydromethanopterin reductase-like flavin-dependent oxidoreductase (luciferase family)
MVVNLVTPEAAAALRASYGDGRLAAWVVGAVDPTPEAFAQMRRGLVIYLGVPGYAEMFAAAGFGALVDAARAGTPPRELLDRVPDELCAAVGLVGSRDEVATRARAYREAGVDEVCVVPVTAGDPGGRRTLAAFA